MESKDQLSTNYLRDYLTLLSIAGAIIILDQLSKGVVRANLALGGVWVPWDWLAPYARIVHWKNTGAAFGILPGLSDVFTILPIIVAVVILFYFPRVPRDDWTLRLAMAMQCGGAVGNLYDRLTIGWVTDFISVWRFPVFNVADASITVGTVILVLGIWYKEKAQEKSALATDVETPNESVAEKVPEEN
jgi:signal peptidase II